MFKLFFLFLIYFGFQKVLNDLKSNISLMSKQSFRDLKETIELKDGEIDELTMELESKKDEINKLKLYSTKLKYQKENLEDKLDNEINNEKAKIKELDDLDKKIKEKQDIIDDKQDQVKYLRALIDDYKTQIRDNTENLEIQLRKISKTYEGLLNQKDQIIEKQNQQISLLIKEKEEMMKTHKTSIISLKRQNDNYRQLLENHEK